ncbi:GNAT family N-acetyltransferase [Legionella pneumophila]|uniref:GNAT family N-acetyltransferase n=1 Tax=Legionella pneumophila TaxID=446 RepID=UPI0021572FE3|nr:GNAT family N-acetyltransferase [Legionella pneumophila]
MTQLYFIGGASGSGKTAVMPYLKEVLSEHFAVYDFDDIGVPEGADKKWRQESTEIWIKKLLSEGKDACLLGQMVLGEILGSPSARQIDKIHFCLLDVSDFERIQRLEKRNTYGADQNMLNWSAWLRMHHQDPKWAVQVIQESAASIMDFGRFNQLANYSDSANVLILDTTDLSLKELAWKIAEWIKSTRSAHIETYVPNTNYKLELNAKNSFKIVDQKLFEFNKSCVPSTQQPELIDINLTIKDADEVIAGICSEAYTWNILYISVFFVEEKYRNQGLGTILLKKVEEEAKRLGVTLIHLDTFEFQAKDFYLKHGYEVFGILNDCPKGHKRYYMKKVLC